MLTRFAALTARLQRSAYALPMAVAAATLLVVISEVAFGEAQRELRRLVIVGQARLDVTQVLRRVTDAESGKRGYLLTGRPEYLTPYRDATEDVRAGLARLQQNLATLDDTEAETLRQRLDQAANGKLSELQEVMALYDSGRRDAAVDLVHTGIGREQMELTRQRADAILQLLNARVKRGLTGVFDALKLGRVGIAAMTLTSLLVLALFLRQGRALARHRDEQETRIAHERDRLEQEVRQRTAELTELAHHLEHVREDEKARLARDLHDELGALLTTAKLDVARLRPRLQQAGEEVQTRLAHLVDTLNSGIALKRRIVEDLRPSSLSNLGLRPALEILCGEFGERLGVPVQMALQPVTLSADAELTVFRLVQEALTNIAKHAQARQVTVRTGMNQGWVEVEVADDGLGFDLGRVQPDRHGLLGMRYRVQAERGELHLDAAPGRGTRLLARLPVPPPATPAEPGTAATP